MTGIKGWIAIGAASLAAISCASDAGLSKSEPRWSALGYLAPGRTTDPEIIGAFVARSDCEDAVEAWMSRQVVGNPVSGECLPIDRK